MNPFQCPVHSDQGGKTENLKDVYSSLSLSPNEAFNAVGPVLTPGPSPGPAGLEPAGYGDLVVCFDAPIFNRRLSLYVGHSMTSSQE